MTQAPQFRGFVREILYDVIRWGDVSHDDALDSAVRYGLVTSVWDGEVRSCEPGDWWVEADGGIRGFAAAVVEAIVEGDFLQADAWHRKARDYGVIVLDGPPPPDAVYEGTGRFVLAPHVRAADGSRDDMP